MSYNFEFMDGFDKYGPISGDSGNHNIFTNEMVGEWSNFFTTFYNMTSTIAASLAGPGFSFQLIHETTLGNHWNGIYKTLPDNYARVVGTFYCKSDGLALSNKCLTFGDAATFQLSLAVLPTGQIAIVEGAPTATVLATSTQSSPANSVMVIQFDITFHNTTGAYKVWLNGVLTSLNATNVNTRYGSSNNYVNVLYACQSNNSGSSRASFVIDHLWTGWYNAPGGTDTPPLTNAVIETGWVDADASVQFTPQVGLIGQMYSNVVASAAAPGSNKIVLRPFISQTGCTLNSIGAFPNATSAGAKFKGVVYADSGGVPTGAPLSSGTEVVGCTTSVNLVLPLVTPQVLIAGTTYWLGYITDTSVSMQAADNNNNGYTANNTYASGAPSSPVMTGAQPTFILWGAYTSPATNFSQLDLNPQQGDASYNSSITLGQQDKLRFAPLVVNPSVIYTVAMKAFLKKADAGARSVGLPQQSGASESLGSVSSIAAPSSYQWVSSYFDNDPTGTPWAWSVLNGATGGPKITA